MVIRTRSYSIFDDIWNGVRGALGMKSGEELSATNPNKPGAKVPEITENNDPIPEKNNSGAVEPIEGFNFIGTGIDKREASAGDVDCSHECGSFLNPFEIGCYADKTFGKCGGSTGLCDVFGAGEACTKYGTYILIGLGIVAAVLTVKMIRK